MVPPSRTAVARLIVRRNVGPMVWVFRSKNTQPMDASAAVSPLPKHSTSHMRSKNWVVIGGLSFCGKAR